MSFCTFPPFKIWAPLPKASYSRAANWWADPSRSLYATNPSRSLYAICFVLSTNYMFTLRSSSTFTDKLCLSSLFYLTRTVWRPTFGLRRNTCVMCYSLDQW
jgi:hypothetical protein